MSGIQGKEQMARMLDALRKDPPKEIGGLQVTSFEDLRDEDGRFGPLKGATDASSRNVLVFKFGDEAKAVVRPSGTEPKAKIYLEVCSDPCPPGATPQEWKKTCDAVNARLKRLSDDFVRQALAKIGLDPSAAGSK